VRFAIFLETPKSWSGISRKVAKLMLPYNVHPICRYGALFQHHADLARVEGFDQLSTSASFCANVVDGAATATARDFYCSITFV
jgi:hypothetical protein